VKDAINSTPTAFPPDGLAGCAQTGAESASAAITATPPKRCFVFIWVVKDVIFNRLRKKSTEPNFGGFVVYRTSATH
jgi:hypothetical protein